MLAGPDTSTEIDSRAYRRARSLGLPNCRLCLLSVPASRGRSHGPHSATHSASALHYPVTLVTLSYLLQELFKALKARGVPGDWQHVLDQIGMFSFTGLTKPQVDNMIKKWHVYLTADGRISMAGLNAHKCVYLAEAMDDSVRTC